MPRTNGRWKVWRMRRALKPHRFLAMAVGPISRNHGMGCPVTRHAQSAREHHGHMFSMTSGAEPFAAITKAAIAAGRDRRAETPAQARNFLDCIRGLFKWAEEAGHVAHDPTSGVKNPPSERPMAFRCGRKRRLHNYQAHWPVGTKERVWFDVLRYTGLRRGDAVTLGRQHVRDGIASIRTEKSRGAVLVTIAIAAGARADAKIRSMWRTGVYLWRQWQAGDKGIIWQSVPGSLPQSGREQIRSRTAQSARD